MQILLADAKIMLPDDKAVASATWRKSDMTTPRHQTVATCLALDMAAFDVGELSSLLSCSRSIAAETWRRYRHFVSAETLPALFAYNGQAYKHLKASSLAVGALRYAQAHLFITSFLYGLLRPMDAVAPYRIGHNITLPSTGGKALNRYWRDILTDILISATKADDGILLHLSTEEYEQLFDWQRVCSELTVVHPFFHVRQPDGGLKIQAVWAKACRGAMLRYVLENHLSRPSLLQSFAYEGFVFNPHAGDDTHPHFVREI